jgi:hypothetical protein
MNLFNTARFILMNLAVFFLYTSCSDDHSREISIVWKDHKAVQLIIPGKHFDDAQHVRIFVTPGDGPAILGDVTIFEDKTIFEPFIPFTRGLSYRIMFNGKLIDTVSIPEISPLEKTEVIAVHPSNGVIPENLLKMYIEFSKPMKEGEALHHIAMIRDKADTLQDVFLDLQPELGKDQT